MLRDGAPQEKRYPNHPWKMTNTIQLRILCNIKDFKSSLQMNNHLNSLKLSLTLELPAFTSFCFAFGAVGLCRVVTFARFAHDLEKRLGMSIRLMLWLFPSQLPTGFLATIPGGMVMVWAGGWKGGNKGVYIYIYICIYIFNSWVVVGWNLGVYLWFYDDNYQL